MSGKKTLKWVLSWCPVALNMCLSCYPLYPPMFQNRFPFENNNVFNYSQQAHRGVFHCDLRGCLRGTVGDFDTLKTANTVQKLNIFLPVDGQSSQSAG